MMTASIEGSWGKSVGSAQSDAERMVEGHLDLIPEWQGRRICYAPVGGGLSNSNWQIRVGGLNDKFFMKVPGSGSEAFVDRSAASEAARQAADIGIAPRYVWFDPESGVEVIEYLADFRACTNGDLKRDEIMKRIISLYRRLHESPPLGLTKTVFDMIDEHLTQALALNARLPADVPLMLDEYKGCRDALMASGLDLVPCHNDPMPGNFLIAHEGDVLVIDYEYSSNNERAYDVALIATEMFFDETRTLSLIEDFYGSTSVEIVARVNVCSALADIKWGLWGCIKRELNRGQWDFDYQKYGLWKLSRARGKMSDPRWGGWVASI